MATAFLFSLAGGMLLIVATARVEQIAWKFLRLIGAIVCALACGVTAWPIRTALRAEILASTAWLVVSGIGLAGVSVALIVLAPAAHRKARAFRLLCAVGGLFGIAAGCHAAFTTFATGVEFPTARLLVVVSQALAGILTGSITLAWLLGHAYLTATKMTIEPLRHFSRMLNWAVSVRVLFLLLSVAAAYLSGRQAETGVLTAFGSAWLIASIRVALGLVAVGVFAYMVSDCVRLRATQSATGILYFGSVLAYVGELAGQQLIAECGWPL